MEALFNLYYFCLFVTKNHVFVLYFLSGEEVGGNARDNRGTGAAMQCRWSAAARAARASEGTSQAPLPRSQDDAADDRFPGPTHLRSVDRDPPTPRGRRNVSGHDEARQAGGGEGGGRLLLPRLFRGRLALFCGRVRHRRDY